VKIGASPLAQLTYDEFSQVKQVGLPGDELIGFGYDSLTQKLQEVSRTRSSVSTSKNKWDFNNRGLIEWEQFKVGDQTLDRSYGYSPNASLVSDQDSREQHKYSFDSIGLMTEMTAGFEKGDQSTRVTSDQQQWLFQTGETASKYELDSMGRVVKTPHTEFKYGPSGRVEYVKKQDGTVITYHYDETGKRIAKEVDGKITESYFGKYVVKDGHIYQRFEVGGTPIGVLVDNQFVSLATDFKGSVLQDKTGKMDVPTAFGERKAERTEHASVIDYVAQGYDPDLRAYRMEQRDYDPVAKRFLTPDPLFLEDPEKCVDSPKECNLYGYAAGNPVSFVDPTGKWAIEFTFSAGGAAGAGWNTSIGLAASFDRELGAKLAIINAVGTEASAGSPGFKVAAGVEISDARTLTEGYGNKFVIGGEGGSGLVGGFNYTHTPEGEHGIALNVGIGHGFEAHTGLEHEYVHIIDSLPGTGPTDHFSGIGPNSTPDLNFGQSSSTFDLKTFGQ